MSAKLFSSLRRSLRAFSNAMLKNPSDMASPCGDPLFVSNDSAKSFPNRSVVDVSLKSNRQILISPSSSINSSFCINSSISIVSKADHISSPVICTSMF